MDFEPTTSAHDNGKTAVAHPPVHAHDPGHTHVPVNYQPRTRVGVVVFAIAVAIGLLIVFYVVQHSHHTEEASLKDDVRDAGQTALPVDAIHARRGSPEKLVTLPGDAQAFYETTIFARTNGYVHKWFADIGDKVTEGQTLATIETPELDDELNQALAKVGQLTAEANVAATAASFAKISYDRWSAAAPDGVVSAQERDQKKSELDTCLAKVQSAQSAVKLGQAQLQQLQTLEKFKNVVAPFAGVITQRHIDLGALVTAGSTSNTSPLYTISQANQIRVFVDVPQPMVPDIHVNMEAFAETRELPGHKFMGIVDRTASSLDMHSRTLRVEVLVPNPDLTLLPGMYVQVTFQTNRANPPVRIPPAALAFGPHGAQVAVVDEEGHVNFRPITIGRDLGDAIEVGSGLKEGEAVALNVGSQVSEGERVTAHFIDGAAHSEAPSSVRTAAAIIPGSKTEAAR